MTNSLLIQGKNVHVFKYIDAAPFEIVCGTDVVYEKTNEIIGATTPDSGRFKEVRPRLISTAITISGVTTSNNDGDISFFHFLQDDEFQAAQDLEIVFTDNGGSERSIRGDFYIETSSVGNPAERMSEYEIKLIGSGAVTESELTDPEVTGENVTSDSYTVSGGVIQDNDWIGLSSTNIIEVCREGSEQLSLGLPYSFNSGTGTITPDAGTVIDGQRMFVIWTY